jgi:hypothetical protein
METSLQGCDTVSLGKWSRHLQQNSVTSKKMWLIRKTTVRTWNVQFRQWLAMLQCYQWLAMLQCYQWLTMLQCCQWLTMLQCYQWLAMLQCYQWLAMLQCYQWLKTTADTSSVKINPQNALSVQAGYCTKNVCHMTSHHSQYIASSSHLGKICSQVFMVLIRTMGHFLCLDTV